MNLFKRSSIIRNVETGPLLESFLVSAIASLLTIRFFLHVTGYPQLGAGRFHIAHMLWGGLFMLIALLSMLVFLGKPIKSAAAVVGGVGFGAFIDELGKFITRSNDYFYQPTVAIIYSIFILLFLVFRKFQQKQILTREEKLMNAMNIAKEGIINDLDSEERALALRLLNDVPGDPLALEIKHLLETIAITGPAQPNYYTRLKNYIREHFLKISEHKYFIYTVVAVIIYQSVFKVIYNFTLAKQPVLLLTIAVLASLLVLGFLHARHNETTKLKNTLFIGSFALLVVLFFNFLGNQQNPHLAFHEWGEVLASTASSILVIYGAIRIRIMPLKGYQTIERALLISIFITQFFTFYRTQFNAVVALALNLTLLAILQHTIATEKTSQLT